MNLSEMLANPFIKLVIAIFFFMFIYKIMYQIGIFFGIEENILDMYYVWLGFFILLITILPTKYSNLK